MIDWNIQSQAQICHGCQRPFQAREVLHTLLFDNKSVYERLDICQACWQAQYGQGATDRKGFISHWQALYAEPPTSRPDPIQKETAETLLRKLITENNPDLAGARFILAVMLERKRIFKVKSQVVQDNQRFFIYEHGPTGDVFTIADPNLQIHQLEAVQKDIARLLEPPSTLAMAGARDVPSSLATDGQCRAT